MTLDDLIKLLETISKEHGNVKVKLVDTDCSEVNHFEIDTNETEHVLNENSELELHLIYVDTTSQHSDLEKAGY